MPIAPFPDWLLALAASGYGARLPRRSPGACCEAVRWPRGEDFVVEELPLYEPAGEGEHLYLELRKRGRTTMEAADDIARAFGVGRHDVGYAGLKDRDAVTTQRFSVPCRESPDEAMARLGASGSYDLRSLGRHRNKLRTGHLRGNRFRLTLRSQTERVGEGAVAALERAVAAVRSRGYPNYFGAQRFGDGGDNVPRALRRLAGARSLPHNRVSRLLVSSVQSAVFNVVLAARAELGAWDTVWLGDVLQRTDSGGVFWVDDAAVEQARLEQGSVQLTGPLMGPRMLEAREQAGELEAEAARLVGLTREERGWQPLLAAQRWARGARRALLQRPSELSIEQVEGAWVLTAELGPGAYVSELLHEFFAFGSGAGGSEDDAEESD